MVGEKEGWVEKSVGGKRPSSLRLRQYPGFLRPCARTTIQSGLKIEDSRPSVFRLNT